MLFTLFSWWLTLTAVGLVGWLLLRALAWPHEAALWAWARPVGLLLLASATWLLGQIMPVKLALGLVGALGLLLGGTLAWRQRQVVLVEMMAHGRAWLAGELLFLLVVAWVLWTRGWGPGIAHTEQPMDMAFLASCTRAVRLPPADPWLAGEPLSYYYLGYFIWGLVARLTTTLPTVAYNLALAATAGLAAQALYGLLHRYIEIAPRSNRGRILGSVVGAALILAASNLALLAESLWAWGALPASVARWLGIPGLAAAPVTGSPLPEGYWWWRVTRLWHDLVLPGRSAEMIVEFPAFSLALGDLHPHLMALPFSVAVISLALATPSDGWRRSQALLLGLLIGGVGLINGWELPLLLLAATLWQLWLARQRAQSWRTAAILCALIWASALLPYLPFWTTLDSQVTGLQVAWLARTQLRGFVLALGAWALPGLLWLWTALNVSRRDFWRWWAGIWMASLALICLVGGPSVSLLRLIGAPRGLALALTLSSALALLLANLVHRPAAPEVGPRLLLLLGLGLCYAVELVYLGDLFGTRMNTLFKFYYQAWWLVAIAALVAIGSWLERRGWRRSLALGTIGLWGLLASYPLLTMPTPTGAWSLDALTPLAATSPDQAAAVRWLQAHTTVDDTLLVAPGGSYDIAAVQLSALSGVPQVLGWVDHERQWGRTTPMLQAREHDIQDAYDIASRGERDALLRRYVVTLVALGPRERALYGDGIMALSTWPPRCTPAFDSDELLLLRCDPR